MSKSVHSVEIEDVLSSIRKLVEAEPKLQQPIGTTESETESAGPRLILTPAQRVTAPLPEVEAEPQESPAPELPAEPEPEAEAEPAPEEVQVAEDSDTAHEVHDTYEVAEETAWVAAEEEAQLDDHSEEEEAALEDEWAEDETAFEAESFEEVTEEEVSEAEETTEPELSGETDLEVPAFLLRDAAAAEDTEPEVHEADLEAHEAEPYSDMQEVHEAEDLDEPRADEWADVEEPETEEVSFDDSSEPEVDLDALVDELTQDDAEEEVVQEVEPAEQTEASDAPQTPQLEILVARAANVEKALSRQPDEWEPDDPGQETIGAGTVEPLPWQDIEDELEEDIAPASAAPEVIEAEATEAPALDRETAEVPRHEMADLAQDDDDWFDPSSVLDEEALRDMVSEIVREELQGALGERITRNVRKLVRREIHRALVAQGIE